jgi:hypothetical protein
MAKDRSDNTLIPETGAVDTGVDTGTSENVGQLVETPVTSTTTTAAAPGPVNPEAAQAAQTAQQQPQA